VVINKRILIDNKLENNSIFNSIDKHKNIFKSNELLYSMLLNFYNRFQEVLRHITFFAIEMICLIIYNII